MKCGEQIFMQGANICTEINIRRRDGLNINQLHIVDVIKDQKNVKK